LVPPEVRHAVRVQTMEKYTEIIDVLRPYATGVMGEISPKMAELYMMALRQNALLAGAYSHAPVREPVKEPEVIESTAEDSRELGRKVLTQLEDLESQLRKDGKY
jgi:hypothetical protein